MSSGRPGQEFFFKTRLSSTDFDMKNRKFFPSMLLCAVMFLGVNQLPAQTTGGFQASPVYFTHEIDTIGNQTYWVHKVEKGHTLYSICRKYGVSATDIIKDSPENQVKIDEVVYIPASDESLRQRKDTRYYTGKRPLALQQTVNHPGSEANQDKLIQKDEEPYATDMSDGDDRLTRKERKRQEKENRKTEKANPSDEYTVSDNAQAPDPEHIGQISSDSSHHLLSNAKINKIKRKRHKDTLRISLMLPLYSNEPGSRKAYVYLPFLEGASLAWSEFQNPDMYSDIESTYPSDTSMPLQSQLPPVRSHSKWKEPVFQMKVFDLTENSQSLQNCCSDPYFLNSDAVVAAAFVSQFENIDRACLQNEIPLIHPLTERDSMAKDNPFYIQLSSSTYTQIEAVAQLIKVRYNSSDILILSDSSGTEKAKALYLHKLLPGSSVSFLNKETEGQLKKLASSTEKTVLVPFYRKEISAVKTVLPLRQSKGNITIISPATWLQYNTIELDYFLKNNLCVYSSFFRPENDPDFIDFSKKYFLMYNGIPNSMAYQGYLCIKWLTYLMNMHNTQFILHVDDELERNSGLPYNIHKRNGMAGFINTEVQFFDLKEDGLSEIFIGE